MPMFGDEDDLKRQMERSNSRFPIIRIKDEPLFVRFLTEPTEWGYYDSYYSKKEQRSIHIEEGERPPRGAKISRRYLANVLVIHESGDPEVKVVEMAETLGKSIYTRWAKSRSGTITDRDFELIKTGEGLQSRYSASPESPLKRPLRQYDDELVDIEDLIQMMAEPPADDEDEPAPKRRRRKVEDDDDAYDEEEAPRRPAAPRKTAVKKAAPKKPAPRRPTKPLPAATKSTPSKPPVRRLRRR